jgi:anti-sigma B factor antagonist
MKIEKVQREGVVLLRVRESKVDSSLAPDFKKELLVAIVQDSPKIVVDLSAVQHMDSSGLGAILFGIRQTVQRNGALVLLNPQPRVLRLIQIAHLTQAIQIFDNEPEAIAAVKSG